jgi:hypothetical protein
LLAEGGQDGLAAEEAAHLLAEQQLWDSKVVVDDVTFHTSAPVRTVPTQLDKIQNVLSDKPKKLSLLKTHVPAAPINMFLDEPADTADPRLAFVRTAHPELFTEKGVDFKRVLAMAKSNVYKPGMTSSWWGSLHDPHLN